MHPLAFLSKTLGHGPGKSHHVVTGLFLDLLYAGNVETRIAPDFIDILLRNHSQFRPGLARKDFDLEISIELILLGPDVAHHLA